jgi:predicted N-formylglutamate amidohydrolase
MNEMSSGDGLPGRLLGPDDPAPVVLSNPAGASSFLLAGDHAGLACPAALGDLGIAPADWARHIASDLGSRQLGEVLAERLDARFIHQRYSRLVIDCNRDPVHPEAIAASSDGTPIQGNRNLGERERGLRVAEIHAPYHHAIAADLARADRGGPPILVALHSFTPVWQGQARPWRAGVLHGGGADRFARAVLAQLTSELGPAIGDNEPYRLDATDYTVPRHAIRPGLPYVELEIRQDELADRTGIAAWADRLARVLVAAAAEIRPARG